MFGMINDDAIAFLDVVSLQHIREAADFAMQLLIGEGAFIAGFAFPDNRRLVPARPCEMTVEAIFRNVEFPADEPLRERRFHSNTFFHGARQTSSLASRAQNFAGC
jgi:hypothetical protein